MRAKPQSWILLAALLAALVKVYCAATTIGTVDVFAYFQFAHSIATEGLITTYRINAVFNHPPLLGDYLGLAYRWAGGVPQDFAFYHRLPGIVADFLVILTLLWVRQRTGRPPWWALGLLAVSPISFMVSGYHGNYDPLLPLGITLAIVACMNDRPALAGIFLGLACQVKIIPLIVAPVFFFFWLHRGKGLSFAVATGLTIVLGWLQPLLLAPEPFFRHVLAYNSTWGWWGVTYLLSKSGIPEFRGVVSAVAANPLQGLVVAGLKLLIVGGALALAWRRRRVPPLELFSTVALVWVVFFALAPGFGVQYLAWVGPFFLLFSVRWSVVMTAAGSVALFVFYHSVSHGFPWNRGFDLKTTFGIWAPALLLPWAIFAFLLRDVWKELHHPTTGGPAAPVAPTGPETVLEPARS